jgi:hypothetical protein
VAAAGALTTGTLASHRARGATGWHTSRMTSVRRCSSATRQRVTALTLAIACLLPAACTSGPPSRSASPVASSPGATTEDAVASPTTAAATATAVARPRPHLSAPAPGQGAEPASTPAPQMTVIESAAVCTTRRVRDDASYFIPVQEVFEGAPGDGWSGATEVVPGPDAADPSRCPSELRPDPFCEVAAPWTGMSDDSFVTAGRLERAVAGSFDSVPPQPDGADPAAGVKGLREVLYQIYDLAPGDPGKVHEYLDRAVRLCAQARDVTVAETAALVGAIPSQTGEGSAQIVLLHRGARLVWVVLDGDGWRAGQDERALAVLVHHLL